MFEVDFKILNQKATPAIYADTLATRPAAGFVGRLFVATDSPYGVFRDTGTAWVQVASNGGGGGSSTGVNGLNGTTNIGLGGTLSNNTTISQNAKDLTFSKTGAEKFNINSWFNFDYTDSTNIRYLIQPNGFGSLNLFTGNGTSSLNSLLQISENIIKTIFNGTAQYGFILDDINGKFQFGDYGNNRKYNCFVVDDGNDKFYTRTSYNQVDFFPDLFYISNNAGSNERFVKLGDFNNYTNGISLVVNDRGKEIYTTYLNNKEGLDLNFDLGTHTLGAGSAYITCQSFNDKLLFNSKGLIFNGTITAGSSAGFSGNHLEITINGTPYVIKLENP